MRARTALVRGLDAAKRAADRKPDFSSVERWLEKSRQEEAHRKQSLDDGFVVVPIRASNQSWEELINTNVADGTAVTAAAETILVPDVTLPANYMYQGRTIKYTLFGRISTVITTPGTWTMRLRWGGVAGVVMAASGAYAPDPTAASTTIAWWIEFFTVCRSVGTSGTSFTMGRMSLSDYDDASATSLKGNLDMMQFPDVPAVATIDTTIAKAISPTVTPSVGTGSITAHISLLEALN